MSARRGRGRRRVGVETDGGRRRSAACRSSVPRASPTIHSIAPDGTPRVLPCRRQVLAAGPGARGMPVRFPGMDGTRKTFWSPDSQRQSVTSGTTRSGRGRCPTARKRRWHPYRSRRGEHSTGFDATWAEDGSIVFTTEVGPLYGVPSGGGHGVDALSGRATGSRRLPHAECSCQGAPVCSRPCIGSSGEDAVAVVSHQGSQGDPRPEGRAASDAACYSRTGHLLFEVVQGRDGNLGGAVLARHAWKRRASRICSMPSGVDEGQSLSASADGTLAYLAVREESSSSRVAQSEGRRAWSDRDPASPDGRPQSVTRRAPCRHHASATR